MAAAYVRSRAVFSVSPYKIVTASMYARSRVGHFRCDPDILEHVARRFGLLGVSPNRMVMRHCLASIAHNTVRIYRPRFAELIERHRIPDGNAERRCPAKNVGEPGENKK